MSYYVLTLRSTLYADSDNPAVNVFTYLTSEVSPSNDGAQQLQEQFSLLFLTDSQLLATVVSDDTLFIDITVTSPPVPTVLHINTDTQAGLAVSPSEPRFITAEFYSPRTVGNIRAGFKRFGLMADSNIIDGQAAPGTFSTQLEELAFGLSQNLNGTVGGLPVLFAPIIVKRIKYTAPSGNDAYRLPTGLDPFNYSEADNWTYKRITTQNTRKG